MTTFVTPSEPSASALAPAVLERVRGARFVPSALLLCLAREFAAARRAESAVAAAAHDHVGGLGHELVDGRLDALEHRVGDLDARAERRAP